jgi:serine-type D-Ala-D-Ala carboxypeptidase (penicillin-binding protein 5/6)
MKKITHMDKSLLTTEETRNDSDDLLEQEGLEEVYKIPVAQQLLLLGVIMLLIFSTTITPKIFALVQKSDNIPASLPESTLNVQNTSDETSKPFEEITLAGKAAYVYDIANQKVLFAKNEDEPLPLASVVKLMTALVAEEILSEKDSVPIDNLSIRQDGDSGLSEGEVFDRLSLSDYVLMSSSNDGAFALASVAGDALMPNQGASAFVQAMNIRAKEIGLTNTHFKNPTGLDIGRYESGADGTAKDMALLMEYIVQNEPNILSFTQEDEARVWSESGQYHDAENTNYYIDKIPGLLGSKTGYTDLAGGNLVIAFSVGLNRPIVAVVLGSTHQERFTDTLRLVKETERYIAQEASL